MHMLCLQALELKLHALESKVFTFAVTLKSCILITHAWIPPMVVQAASSTVPAVDVVTAQRVNESVDRARAEIMADLRVHLESLQKTFQDRIRYYEYHSV